jgi:hypothetical protein
MIVGRCFAQRSAAVATTSGVILLACRALSEPLPLAHPVTILTALSPPRSPLSPLSAPGM